MATQWCICYLRSTRLSCSPHYLILRLSSRTFSGLVGEVAYTPIKSPDVSITVGIFPSVDFFVLQGVLSNSLEFQKNLMGSATFLGVPLRLFVSGVFGGGSKVVGKFDVNFRTSWILFCLIFLSFSVFVAGLMK